MLIREREEASIDAVASSMSLSQGQLRRETRTRRRIDVRAFVASPRKRLAHFSAE